MYCCHSQAKSKLKVTLENNEITDEPPIAEKRKNAFVQVVNLFTKKQQELIYTLVVKFDECTLIEFTEIFE